MSTTEAPSINAQAPLINAQAPLINAPYIKHAG